jgi:C4-dicarboxylate-specific signal transduction histidine kinase
MSREKTPSPMSDIKDRLRRAEQAIQAYDEALAHLLRLDVGEKMLPVLVHELKQPLAAIAWYASGTLRSLDAGSAADKLRAPLEQIVAEARRAAELIQCVREFLETGHRAREVACMAEVARDAWRFAEPEAQRAQIALEVHAASPSPVRIDRVQMRQVVLNLLWNAFEAVRERDQDARVVLLRVASCGTTAVMVTVRDTGSGLPPDLMARVFDPFVTTRPAGLGLGLFISRRIVESHGGKLWVASNSSGGATFGFALPLSEGASPAAPAPC